LALTGYTGQTVIVLAASFTDPHIRAPRRKSAKGARDRRGQSLAGSWQPQSLPCSACPFSPACARRLPSGRAASGHAVFR